MWKGNIKKLDMKNKDYFDLIHIAGVLKGMSEGIDNPDVAWDNISKELNKLSIKIEKIIENNKPVWESKDYIEPKI
jgi:hypothetical protein